MQDPRIRLGSTVLLSVAAFISIPGALLSVLWWILCTGRTTSFHDLRTVGLVLMLPLIAASATSLSGGDGASYLVRVAVVLLIASWAYSERYPGEFLDVSVWLLGQRLGFDIGLIGEMSLSSTEILADEMRRTRIALRQKGQHLSLPVIPPVMTSLLMRQLRLAHERAAVLTLRGYRGGGTLCPVFQTPYRDIGAGAVSMLIFTVSLVL